MGANQTHGARLGRHFYVVMSLAAVAVVVYGFSHTIGDNLFHPDIPRPALLYAHAAVFSAWLIFFVLQATLVASGHVRWHRRAGWFGVGLGAMIPFLGVATAIVMGRFDREQLHQDDVTAFLIIPLFDMLCFTTAFALAVWWRRRPDRHRRLMLIATCALTAAGFGRFPPSVLPPYLFYGGVDLLILCGVARDLIVDRRVHPVYLIALPPLVVGQVIVTYTAFESVAAWLKIASAIIG